MPSRKSDASRRSDVSAARFVLAEDTNMTSAPEPAAAAAAAAPPTASAATQKQTDSTATSAAAAIDQPQQANQSFSESVRGGGGGGGGTTSPSAEKKDHHGKEKEKEKEKGDAITIEDLNLPKSIITRLAKGVLPPNTQIQANAILALSKSATVFISYLASTANDFTVASNKKTIMPADVFKALDETEFGFMRERLEAEFAKFNEVQTSKRSTYRKKVAAAKKAASGSGGADGSSQDLGGAETSMMSVDDQTENEASFLQKHSAADSGGQPRAKKAKTDGGATAGVDGGHDEVSDAETVPEEAEEEEEEDDEEEVEEEEEDDEEEGEEDDDREDGEEGSGAPDEDEALDDDSE